jgi:hypothetical protein
MEFALIHDNQLILGPIGFNVRMINSELKDLELSDKISPQSYIDVPIHFSDNLTHLLPIEKIVEENGTPIKVTLTYEISNKTLEEVKNSRKQEVAPARREKENAIINLTVNDVNIEVSTSREERLMLASKVTANPGQSNYKFGNTWVEVNTENLQYIVEQIDNKVQEAFDWELLKLQEIDACTTIDEVYNVVIREPISQE